MFQDEWNQMNYRAKTKLPEPKTVADICELGIKDPNLAICCIAEVLEQLYNQEQFKFLMVVDGWNKWLTPSSIPSYRYVNDRRHRSSIPCHDFALVRLF